MSLDETDLLVRVIASSKSLFVIGRSKSSFLMFLRSEGCRLVSWRRIDIIEASLGRGFIILVFGFYIDFRL